MQLTKVERLILANQFRILEGLDSALARECKEACEILQSGYTLEYETLVSAFDEDVPEETCRQVRDTLDMFRALQKALRELPAGSVTPQEATFQGFDGNEETAHFAYTQFLIETQGKWGESKTAPLNSHWPKLGQYRAMLAEWHSSASKWDLTAEDVKRIVSRKG